MFDVQVEGTVTESSDACEIQSGGASHIDVNDSAGGVPSWTSVPKDLGAFCTMIVDNGPK